MLRCDCCCDLLLQPAVAPAGMWGAVLPGQGCSPTSGQCAVQFCGHDLLMLLFISAVPLPCRSCRSRTMWTWMLAI